MHAYLLVARHKVFASVRATLTPNLIEVSKLVETVLSSFSQVSRVVLVRIQCFVFGYFHFVLVVDAAKVSC